MARRRLILAVAIVAGALMLGAVACGGDDNEDGGATTIATTLTEYVIGANPSSAPAGDVTFDTSNLGAEEHEMVVIRTDLAADALPTRDDGSVDESGEGIEVIGEIEEMAAGDEESKTLNLDAGNYVLICNIVEQSDAGETESHYALGMYTAFTVTE